MSRDQSIGAIILLGSVIGISVYAWLLYAYSIVVLQNCGLDRVDDGSHTATCTSRE
jgi:hypothetical protein